MTAGSTGAGPLTQHLRDPRWLRRTLFATVAVCLVTGIVSLILPKTYRAEAKIMPHGPENSASSLLNLAASSGLGDILGGEVGAMENPVLTYPEILSSRDLLEKVAWSRYPPAARDSAATVMRALKIRGTDRRSLDKAVRLLADITRVDPRLRSGLIAVSAVTPDSVLSAYIVKRMLEELDRFNVETRSSRERATRKFVEDRKEEARQDLAAREQALASFRQTNLRIGNSPQLQLEQERLEREVSTQSEVYRLLAREYETARIEEMRDTPTFSIVDPPEPPARKYRPRVLFNVLVAFVAALGYCALAVYVPWLAPWAKTRPAQT